MVEATALDVDLPSLASANRYQATLEATVRSAIERLPIDLGAFDFVDYGAGKGRVILIASTYPFRKVIGVEFSPSLHKIALDNVARFPCDLKRAPITLICGDAGEFEIPNGDAICFLANPFGPPIIDRVANRIAAHTSQSRVFVLYYNPEHADVFHSDRFKVLWRDRGMLALKALPDRSGPAIGLDVSRA